MNVLYYCTGKLNATSGGTERTTITMARALTELYSCRCFSVYERETDTPKDEAIVEEAYWNQVSDDKANIRFLRGLLERWNIDVVIVQGAFVHVGRFREAAKGLKCRIIFAHHFQPRFELAFNKLKDVLTARPRNWLDHIRKIRNIVLYPRMRAAYERSLAASYGEAYRLADQVVLLCKGFIPAYKDFGGVKDESKFAILPNGLSFNEFITEDELDNKMPVALIVARLEEASKQLSKALRIWKLVKEDPRAEGWRLDIVGEGRDRKRYEKMVRKEDIPDVLFLGRQQPIPYYRKASLFMMTSCSEAWGLTLTESQQMGVVPVAFDTYESLPDIVTNGINGIIVPPDDYDAYTAAILRLMSDPAERRRMALNGLNSCRRYLPSTIAARWWELINGRND